MSTSGTKTLRQWLGRCCDKSTWPPSTCHPCSDANGNATTIETKQRRRPEGVLAFRMEQMTEPMVVWMSWNGGWVFHSSSNDGFISAGTPHDDFSKAMLDSLFHGVFDNSICAAFIRYWWWLMVCSALRPWKIGMTKSHGRSNLLWYLVLGLPIKSILFVMLRLWRDYYNCSQPSTNTHR